MRIRDGRSRSARMNQVDDRPDVSAAFSLDDVVALVTGASAGLGARFARVLDAQGARVILVARRQSHLEVVAAQMIHETRIICADLSKDGSNEAIVEQAVEEFGRIDVVVANAGITTVTPASRETSPGFRELLDVDLVGPFALARAAAHPMREAGSGSIISVGTALTSRSSSLSPAAGYIAAKAGLVGLTKELAVQWGRYGIT